MTLPARALDASIGIRVSRDERRLFHAVAEAQGLNLSDAVRAAMAVEAARLGVLTPAATAG